MEETWLQKVIHFCVFLGISAGVLFVGWDEPLSYRFMSDQQIAEVEKPAEVTPPVVEPPPIQSLQRMSEWQSSGTSLDRAPFDTKNGRISYSENYDHKELGSPTESPLQQYKQRGESGTKSAPAPAVKR